jgi:hypothetical protein
MDSYVKLVQQLTKPISELMKTIDDESAKLFLSQKFSDKYQFHGGRHRRSMGGATGNGEQNSGESQLVAKDGSKLDSAELEGAIAEAKRDLAQQQQDLLNEMLLMGVNRMVVDKGTIKASVDFNIRATESISKYDEAQEINGKEQSLTKNLGGSLSLLSWVGVNLSSGSQTTDTCSNIAISTANTDSQADTTARTTVHGEVEINFKSDYFKLDNFKDILMKSSGQRSQVQKSPVANSSNGTPNAPAQTPPTAPNTGSDNGDS